jgi:hypothetical protein
LRVNNRAEYRVSDATARAQDAALQITRISTALIDPTIALHHGRVVKCTGDGIIIEFRSVVDAVRCAIEVQSGLVERNAGAPEDRRLEFRVGIHLGDVVEESDGDLMAGGVNIAARLESIAAPGSICLSEDAYRQVKHRVDLAVTDLGPTQLKNIAEPIRVYSLEVGKPAQARPVAVAAPASSTRTVNWARPFWRACATVSAQSRPERSSRKFHTRSRTPRSTLRLSRCRRRRRYAHYRGNLETRRPSHPQSL